jgi:putative DNA primase/helicase
LIDYKPESIDPHALVVEDVKSLFFYGKTFVPMKVVDFLIDRLPMIYLITPLSHKKDSTIWRYTDDTGIYSPFGISWIQATMQKLLGEESTTSRQNEVVQQLRIRTYDWDNEFNNENPDFVMLMNGAFCMSERKLYSYSPAYKAKARLPIFYDPGAACPNITKFIGEVFHKDDIDTIEEWLAYHLVSGYPFAKILFLIGDGANGKSTFLNLLNAILGTENVSKKTLFELNNDKFAASKLYGKLANISPDVSEDEIKHSGKLKALTGNEEIDARKIYQSSFSYINRAKLNCAANKPPKTPDVTRAWFRRLLFVICDMIFSPEEADPNILETLTTREELSGIFNVMLDARERLLENGRFSRDETPDEVQEKYDLMSDPITAFIEDCVIHEAGATYEKDAFYLAFRTYCRKRGFTPCLKSALTKELNTRYGRSITVTNPRRQGKRVPTWEGLTLDLETHELWESGKGGTSGKTSLPYILKKSQERDTDTPTTSTTPTSLDLEPEWDDPDYPKEDKS